MGSKQEHDGANPLSATRNVTKTATATDTSYSLRSIRNSSRYAARSCVLGRHLPVSTSMDLSADTTLRLTSITLPTFPQRVLTGSVAVPLVRKLVFTERNSSHPDDTTLRLSPSLSRH